MIQRFKEKKQQKREEKLARRLEREGAEKEVEEEGGGGEEDPVGAEKRRARKERRMKMHEDWKASLEVGQRVIIDCGFLELMRENEINSLSQQIAHSYGYTKKSDKPMRIHLSSLHGKLEEQLMKLVGFDSWPVCEFIVFLCFHCCR
jgi:tRNA (guanine9-N1)-methyltransferase